MNSIIILFLQSASDIDKAVKDVERELSRGGGGSNDTTTPSCCAAFFLIIFIGLLWFLVELIREAQKTGKIYNIEVTRNRVIAAICSISLIVGVGLFFTIQKQIAEEKGKAEFATKQKERKERMYDNATQSANIICGNRKYSAETCRRIKSMTVEQIIDFYKAYKSNLKEQELQAVNLECRRENINECSRMVKQKSKEFDEFSDAIDEVVAPD
jgi:hypothetical protein